MIKILFDITPDIAKLRQDVFVREQGVSLQEELCDDEREFVHICKFENDKLVAYCRIKLLSNNQSCQNNEGFCDSKIQCGENYAKIGRVAVDIEYRKKGFGWQIMSIAHEFICKNYIKVAKISAQLHALSFYQKMGYTISSDEYVDCGIRHVDMIKVL